MLARRGNLAGARVGVTQALERPGDAPRVVSVASKPQAFFVPRPSLPGVALLERLHASREQRPHAGDHVTPGRPRGWWQCQQTFAPAATFAEVTMLVPEPAQCAGQT